MTDMIHLLEKPQIRELMVNWIYVAMAVIPILGIGLFFAIPNVESEYTDSYLFAGLIVLEVTLFFANNIIQNKKEIIDKRQKHAEELIEKIYSKLANLHIIDNNRYFELGVPKPLSVIEQEEEYEVDVSEYWDIPELEKPYLEWAFKHLEKYPELEKLLEKVFTSVKKNNEELDKADKLVKEKIKSIFKTHFPNIQEYDKSKNIGYEIEVISNELINHHYMESWDLPQEDPDYKWEISCKEVYDENENRYYIKGGYNHVFVVCLEKNEINIPELNRILNSLGHDSNLRKEFTNILSLRLQCEETHNQFIEQMNMFIKELKSGVELKGVCTKKLGY